MRLVLLQRLTARTYYCTTYCNILCNSNYKYTGSASTQVGTWTVLYLRTYAKDELGQELYIVVTERVVANGYFKLLE